MSDKNLYPRMQNDLARAVVRAYRQHGTVRRAAHYLGMPRATFHEVLAKNETYQKKRIRTMAKRVSDLKRSWGVR